MELPNNDIVRQGYLKFRGKSLGIWKKQWTVLKKASSQGGRRMECYNDDKSSKQINKCEKLIELNDVIQIQGLPSEIKKHGVSVMFSDKSSKTFCCDSDREADKWMKAIEAMCLTPNTQPVNNMDLLQAGPVQKELTELFHVYLVRAPTLPIYGECLLQVTQEHVHLLDCTNPAKRHVTWPLNALRRYGSDTTKFTFESGRFCDTGEGIFIFNTTDGESIYQKLHSATIAIAEMHRIMQMSTTKRNVVAHRTRSSPATTTGTVPPEPPPRPMTTPSTPEATNSALNSPLPPIPGGPVESFYLNPPYHDEGAPFEAAPRPPTITMNMPTHFKGRKGPDMYLNMMEKAQGSQQEYYGNLTEMFGDSTSAEQAQPPYVNSSVMSERPSDEDDPFSEVRRSLASLGLAAHNPAWGATTATSGLHPQYVNQSSMQMPPENAEEAETSDKEDYEPPIYEEKALSREFRKYLKDRKDGEEDG